MTKKLGLFIGGAVLLAGMLFAVRGYACGGRSASMAALTCGGASHPAAQTTMAGTGSCSSGSQCPAHSEWADRVCGSRGYYAANVFAVHDGRMLAVCQGQVFPVTANTPFLQIGRARYYFSSEATAVSCTYKMMTMEPQIDREATALATAYGNVVDDAGGKIWAACPACGHRFLVTADSPAKVMNGEIYYFDSPVELATVAESGH